jgi:hypothetical protein
MAVGSGTPYNVYTGNGVTTVFAFGFTVLAADDLAVTVDGVANTDYTISGVGAAAGGSITFNTAPANGTEVVLQLDVVLERNTDYQDNGDFQAETVNADFDRLWQALISKFDALTRTLRVPETAVEIPEFPAAASRALRLAGFDANGDPTVVAPSDQSASALALLLSSYSLISEGAGAVGFSSGLSYPANTTGKKLLQIVHVEDEGAVGDGTTNDYTAIAAAITKGVARGVPVVFDGTKTYSIDVASWSIPAGAVLQMNGATIKCATTSTGNTVWLTVNARCKIDDLKISVPTAIRRDRVVLVDGDDTRIGKIKVHSVDQQANSEAADGAVQITGLRPYVGLVDVKNYDRALIVYSSTDAEIARVLIESYVRGMYLYDNVGLKVDSGRIYTASANASGTAGHNGVLMGCNSTDAQRNVEIANVHVSDSGEHSWRIGGPEQQSNLRFSNCSAHNCGGNGFKVLGTDSGTPTARNKAITLDNFIAEDVGEDSGLSATNRCGVYLAFCDDVQVTCPIVRPRNNANSAQYGIHINACGDILVSSPDLREAVFDGVLLNAADGDNTNVQINGGQARGCDRHGLNVLTAATMSTGRCTVWGFNAVANSNLGFNIANSGTMSDNLFNLKTYANTNGMGASNNTPGTTLQVSGDPGSTAISGISARNGSWIDDTTTLNIRKAGSWTAL